MKIRIKEDFQYKFLIAMCWCSSILQKYVRAAFMRIPILRYAPDFAIVCVYLAVILLSLKGIRLSLKEICFVLGVLLISFLSPLLFPATQEIWSEGISRFLLKTLPWYFIGIVFVQENKNDEMMNLLYVLSCVAICFKILFSIFFGEAMSVAESKYAGDMDTAYKLLPHICVVQYYVFAKPNWKNILILIAGSIFLMLLGSRGPVLIALISLILMFVFFSKAKHKKAILLIAGTAAVIFAVSPLFITTIRWLQGLAIKMGLSVRVFDKILSRSIGYSSGRNLLYSRLLTAMNGHEFLGYGLFGDRVLINTYAHSLPLELWVDFGYIIGTLIFLCILISLIAAFRRTSQESVKAMILVLTLVGVVKLFLSGSFLQEQMLYMLFGISSCTLKEARARKELQNHTISSMGRAAHCLYKSPNLNHSISE